MTDDEPEPFTMPADPGAAADAPDDDAAEAEEEAATTDAADEPGGLPGGLESIADLIDEAARTAAAQAESEQATDAHDDGADLWGDGPAGSSDASSVWDAAEAASSGRGVWQATDAQGDVWADHAPRRPSASADPTRSSQDPTVPTGTPAAAEDMVNAPSADDEPDTFIFSVGDDRSDDPLPEEPTRPPAVADEEEPEPFSFASGPATSAPMPLPSRVEDDEEEPETFTFAVADDAPADDADEDVVVDVTTDAAPAPEPTIVDWAVATPTAADDDGEHPDDDPWTFDVMADASDSTTIDEDAPLAEAAQPRPDGGWRDLEAEAEPGWSVPDLPPRTYDDEDDEPDRFSISVGDDDPDDVATFAVADDEDDDDAGPVTFTIADDQDDDQDDEPVTFSVADEQVDDDPGDEAPDAPPAVEMPPADVVTAQVHDALGDLLGHTADEPASFDSPASTSFDTPAPAASPPESAGGGDDLDAWDDVADLDLDQFDELATDTEEPDVPAGNDEDDDELDAPSAAREVMEPGSVSFSSKGRKKRGFFG